MAAAQPDRLLARLGRRLAAHLAAPRHVHGVQPALAMEALRAGLRPADVLLVDGHSRFSTAIQYLTQSTWSHAALYVGASAGLRAPDGRVLDVVEADVVDGVRAVGLSAFAGEHLRICRALSLDAADVQGVVDHVAHRLGHRYDLRNVLDLLRWLLPTPPVPTRWRRRLIALGSGDPTRAICSTLIAGAFQAVRYPILPTVERRTGGIAGCPACEQELLHIRHSSLFVPRDFDVSPYFQVIKPGLAPGFDHHRLQWAATTAEVAP